MSTPNSHPRNPLYPQVHPLHPDFRCYAKQALPLAGSSKAQADPTAGFEAALFLLHTCSSLYLYGVTVETSNAPPGPADGAGGGGAAGGAAAGAAAQQPLNWYFPKMTPDGRIPQADWNRTKEWVVDEWQARDRPPCFLPLSLPPCAVLPSCRLFSCRQLQRAILRVRFS